MLPAYLRGRSKYKLTRYLDRIYRWMGDGCMFSVLYELCIASCKSTLFRGGGGGGGEGQNRDAPSFEYFRSRNILYRWQTRLFLKFDSIYIYLACISTKRVIQTVSLCRIRMVAMQLFSWGYAHVFVSKANIAVCVSSPRPQTNQLALLFLEPCQSGADMWRLGNCNESACMSNATVSVTLNSSSLS